MLSSIRISAATHLKLPIVLPTSQLWAFRKSTKARSRHGRSTMLTIRQLRPTQTQRNRIQNRLECLISKQSFANFFSHITKAGRTYRSDRFCLFCYTFIIFIPMYTTSSSVLISRSSAFVYELPFTALYRLSSSSLLLKSSQRFWP